MKSPDSIWDYVEYSSMLKKRREKTRRWRENNKEKFRQSQRKSDKKRWENNRERLLKARRDYYYKNKEKCLETQRLYRLKNLDIIKRNLQRQSDKRAARRKLAREQKKLPHCLTASLPRMYDSS